MLVLVTLGANSCGGHDEGDGKKPMTSSKQIKCDPDVDIDLAHPLKGVNKQAVYVCGGASFSWKIPSGHKFTVMFSGDTPFSNGSTFDQDHPTGTAPTLYGELTVYKYSITVDSNPRVDPQVVAGGN
jgi:hypothetical protein